MGACRQVQQASDWSILHPRRKERVIEKMRKYPHLYDSRSPHYKDSTYSSNSWREIAMNVGLDTAETVRKWKNARDKFSKFS